MNFIWNLTAISEFIYSDYKVHNLGLNYKYIFKKNHNQDKDMIHIFSF